MIEQSSGSPVGASHHARFWRWLVFDPPMRDVSSRGLRKRAVSCNACRCDLGSTDDPLDGFFMAWRHRRKMRRRATA